MKNIQFDNNWYKKMSGLVLSIGFFCIIPATQAKENITLKLNSGEVVEFNLNSGGSIKVEAWDREEAKVSYSDNSRSLDDYDISFNETGSGIEINSELIKNRNRGSSLRLVLQVPRSTSIEVNDSAGGDIDINGLEGDFSGRTGGGEITIKNSSGTVDLKTGGGELVIKDSTLDGRVITGGGEVLVENVVGDFDANSGGGDVVYRNVRRHDGSIAGPRNLKTKNANIDTVLISSAGGGINVSDAPEGANVKTGGGNIKVRNASRFVFAQTGGGDVSVELEEGAVKVSTGAGEVDVTVSRDSGADGDITIFTGLGDVSLTLPSDFSMSLDIELGFTRNSSQDFIIDTNLDIDTEQSKSWTSRHGSPRKIIYGTAELNGGLHKIKIRTTNGNVVIKSN